MSIDLAKSMFRNLAIEGTILSESALGTLIINYLRTAKDAIKQYSDDAAINGLTFDYHQETIMVEAFTKAVQTAGRAFLEDPLYSPLIPSWNRVISAIPDFLGRLHDVVEKENAG
jgi:glucosyl-3-phosphoglycerate synthase